VINNGLFTSNTDLWATPRSFFDEWNNKYNFKTDVCATAENAKCEIYFSPEENGLLQEWKGTCWMNPPYGREISKWVKKAYESSLNGAVVVCLLPARTDTRWFHDYCLKGEITFVRGRLKFNEVKWNAPFPNMVVIFGGAKK
jgi:phage N-6-adenine-methyltransferase